MNKKSYSTSMIVAQAPGACWKRLLFKSACHPELVEGSVQLPFTFAEAELILRQAQDDGILKRAFAKVFVGITAEEQLPVNNHPSTARWAYPVSGEGFAPCDGPEGLSPQELTSKFTSIIQKFAFFALEGW